MERRALRHRFTLGVIASLAANLSFAVDHSNMELTLLSSPTALQDCVYFSLVGVPVADPLVPGLPWIAVPRSHLGFKEIVAFLTTAKATGQRVTVRTSNQVACGYIAVDWLYIN